MYTGRDRQSIHQLRRPVSGRVRQARRVACALAYVLGCATVVAAPPAAGQTVAAPAAAPATNTPGLPAAGAYSYALVADSSADIKAAINETVSPMFFITRGIARSRLTKINPLPHRMRVQLAADTASVAFDDDAPVASPLNGTVVPWFNPLAKETDQVHAAVAGDTLRQTFVAADGARENALIFNGDGSRVLLHVTVTSHRLPKPLSYDLLFRLAR